MIPDGITKEDVLDAISAFSNGLVDHAFGDSEKFDLIYEGKAYPPKAIIGIAARRIAGAVLLPSDFTGGENTKCFRILRSLGFEVTAKRAPSESDSVDWTEEEVRAAVSAYLRMLSLERANKPYKKSEYNLRLRQSALSSRSKGSIEYRMQNISSVLQDLGLPWIRGYKPQKNVGVRVESMISRALQSDASIVADIRAIIRDGVPKTESKVGLRPKRISPPIGQRSPSQTTRSAVEYRRCELVIDWVKQEANGRCELCDSEAPFCDDNGTPYLEVHHVRQLALGGSDTISNAVALCPNCHRRCHFSKDKGHMIAKLFAKIPRLKPEG